MTSINTQHLIEQQIPYHIRESNPVFNKFLEYYYQFQTQSKIPDIIQEVRKYNDIDETDEQFLLEFFEEFKYLPATILVDKRLVAKHIYDIYKSKGSETSLKLLFRIVYGEEIDVYYPSQDILKPSDGKWIQYNVVSLDSIDGEIKSTSNRIVFTTETATFEFKIESTESIDDIVRVFFDANTTYVIDQTKFVKIYTNSVLDFVGSVVVMPSTIEVIDGGAFWQLGQLIVLPGEIDTICQITRLGENGAIKKLNIIQYGKFGPSSQAYTISPFRYSPVQDYTETFSEQLQSYPLIHDYRLNISDSVNVTDTILYSTYSQEYVITGYVLDGYVSNDVSAEINSPILSSPINPDITIAQWIQSKALIRVRQSISAKTSGVYLNTNGQLSAANIKLQDNFFYQLFSYVINTSRVLSDVQNVISLVHPAGIKYFINTSRESSIDATSIITRTMSVQN